jgi:dUTP pyrophosphatase
MTKPSVPMLIGNELAEVLRRHHIKAYLPAYGGESAGLDLYNVGPDTHILPTSVDHTKDWAFDGDADTDLSTQQFKKIFKTLLPTGLFLAIPRGWVGLIQERGSITKHPLKIRAGVIDPNYTGEVFVNCVNLSTHPWQIKHGDKLPFQLVIVQANTQFQPVTKEDYLSLTSGSSRKEGMIGSSDTK